jgi:hypothetical protein
MFQRNFMVVQRTERPTSGIGITVISNHWSRRAAELKAEALAAHWASHPEDWPPGAYTWEVDARCK